MNLNKTDLSHLCESERYWLGWLNRGAEKRGWSRPEDVPAHHSVFFSIPEEGISQEEQIECYLYDSLMVGLHTREPLLALRCFSMARYYEGYLKKFPLAPPVDAITVLRLKVERLMER